MTRPTAIEPDDFPWFDYSRYTFSLGLAAGSSAHLSGHSASEYDAREGRIVVAGGMERQTRTAYAKVERILDAAGFGLSDVVRIVENVTVAGLDHYQEAEAVRGDLFGAVEPSVNTVVVEQLLRPAALIEVEVTASRADTEAFGVTSTGRAGYAPVVRSGDVVYLSTVLPENREGAVVGSGDVAAQVEQIFENATRSLALLGMDLSNVVRTFETVRPEALGGYKYTGRVRREHLGPVYPAAAGIVQRRVASSDDVLIAYDFVAYAGDVEAVNPGWERYAKLTYSPAVRAGDLLFMSGQAALDPTTERAVYAGDIGEQARYTYENVAEVLAAAGLKPRNLIKTIEFVTPQGLRGYRSVSGVRQAILEEPWPASTGALCHSLLRPEFEIEIIPTAMAFEED